MLKRFQANLTTNSDQKVFELIGEHTVNYISILCDRRDWLWWYVVDSAVSDQFDFEQDWKLFKDKRGLWMKTAREGGTYAAHVLLNESLFDKFELWIRSGHNSTCWGYVSYANIR